MPLPNWHPYIASRVFNTPLLIHPAKYDAIVGALGREWGIDVPPPTPAAYSALPGEYRRPGYRVVGGIAVVEIFGVLAHRGSLDADSAPTSSVGCVSALFVNTHTKAERGWALSVRIEFSRIFVLSIALPDREIARRRRRRSGRPGHRPRYRLSRWGGRPL